MIKALHYQSRAITHQPFLRRMSAKYVEIVQALAWWNRTTQRNFFRQPLDEHRNENIYPEKLEVIIKQYRNHG